MTRGLRIQYILSLALLLMLGVVVILALGVKWYGGMRKERLLAKNKSANIQRLHTVFDLYSQSKVLIIDDYTYWDEMVDFVHGKDGKWGAANLVPMMENYGFDFSLVLNRNCEVVWLNAQNNQFDLLSLAGKDQCRQLMLTSGSRHWYYSFNGRLFEMFSSTIHPTGDPHHSTRANGMLVAGNVIDSVYLNNLGMLCDAQIKVNVTGVATYPANDQWEQVMWPLEGFDKNVVGYLEIVREHEYLGLFNRWSQSMLTLLLVSMFLVLLFFHFTLVKYVGKPLRLMGQVLMRRKPMASLSELNRSVLEYRQIGEMIEKHVEQRREVIRLKEKAEESDRLKSVFLANMSHEIRTPINGILGFSEMICHDINPDEATEYKKIIKSCSHDLMHIMDDIIEISKIDAGVMHLTPHNFSLAQMLDELNAIFLYLIESKRKPIRLIVQRPMDDIVLYADGYRIKQMLSVLLDNAVKFTEKGHVELTFKMLGDRILFRVKDTGIGIRKEKREVIFERFRQSDEQLARHHGGNGLGLAIFKRLAEMMEANITLESEVGKGSTFTLVIPLLGAHSHTEAVGVGHEKNT